MAREDFEKGNWNWTLKLGHTETGKKGIYVKRSARTKAHMLANSEHFRRKTSNPI